MPQFEAIDWQGFSAQIDQFERDENPENESCLKVAIAFVRGMIPDAQKHGLQELSEEDVAERSQPLWHGQEPQNDILFAMLRSLPFVQTVHADTERRVRLRVA